MSHPRARKQSLAGVAVNRRRCGELRTLLSPATSEATAGFLGVVDLKPGECVTEHWHPYSEEFLYVVSGTVQVRCDDEKFELAGGEGLHIPIGVRHRLDNHGTEPVSAVFALAPLAPRPELGHVDTEKLP